MRQPNDPRCRKVVTGKPSLKWNALSNVAATMVNVVVAFLVTPAILAHLGERRFGMWTLVSSLVGYFSILRFGVGSAVFRFVPHFRGAGDHNRVNSVASTCMAFYLGIAVVIFVLMFSLASPISHFFHADDEFTSLVRVIGIAAAFELPAIVYSTLLQSYEFFFAANVVAIVRALIQRTSLLWCVKAGYGLVGMGLTQVAVALFCLVVQAVGVHVLCRDIRLSPRNVRVSDLKLLLSFGVLVLWASGANFIVTESPKQVVGKVISLEALGCFGILVLLVGYYRSTFLSLTRILRPRFAYLAGKSAEVEARDLLLNSTRYVAILATGVALLLCVAGPSFVMLWTKRAVLEKAGIPLVIMTMGNLVFLSHNVANDLLFGLGRQRKIAEFDTLEAVMTVGLTLGLARFWGMTGAALGVSVPFFLVRGIVQPFYTCRLLGLSLRDYYGKCILSVWFLGGGIGLLSYMIRLDRMAANWKGFIAVVVCVGTLYTLLGFFTALTSNERTQLKEFLFSIISRTVQIKKRHAVI